MSSKMLDELLYFDNCRANVDMFERLFAEKQSKLSQKVLLLLSGFHPWIIS